MSSVVVVGSGPNGLACAATLASRGVEVTVIEAGATIGGGTRSSELTEPGLLHDECSATHPMVVNSPAAVAAGLELERHGLEWAWPEVDLAHPLDGGGGAAMLRSLEATAAGLGEAGGRWKRVFGPPSKSYEPLTEDIYHPLIHVPRHPLRLLRFGLPSALPATALVRYLGTPEAAALFGGIAAHAYAPLDRPLSSAIGMALTCAGHACGWPVAKGGSIAIANAWAEVIRESGGRIETGRRVRSLAELPAADAVVLDLAPRGVLELAGDRLPARVARAYRRYKHGPGAFKLDLAVEGGVPWTQEAARRAGTVHVIGSFEELVHAEAEINRGRMPERPFVLVGQQYLADPQRSRGDLHPLWLYAHVPAGYTGDATEAILDQVERFAPGFRERIVAHAARTPAEFEAANPNFPGGDILCGANTPLQTVLRPRVAPVPYWTGAPGLFVCSAATPPGPGAHGICGFNAAEAVLRTL
ncbi:MAG TPA: NAD(P)/FAD-dependent oxidoreductase [Solirubrobacterales bacterium]|nr:NAD(P)/FAD-dependent oxidoreductase [Solirubrobacterales bacterium]